ncbi:MAG: threonine synthase, partial [Helicobacter sp.]|nr:threonine synthase [Helicobacter sp.]
GDTGPATLQAFQNDANVFVVCLYPKNGTSDVQRRQMTTVNAPNVRVLGIDGNFDDAQSALKRLLADDGFKQALEARRFRLSAANSVNFGRIIFQIVYHAYTSLGFPERGVDIIVPSGNFGNALGAFYAKLIGFDIGKVVIASNANNVLTDWITRGVYDIKERALKQTQSPAMDILKSSNVERILYMLFGASRTRELLESLDSKKIYALSAKEYMEIQNYFDATFCTDEECRLLIARYAKLGHLVDPHTATALKAYEQFNNISTRAKIVVSTAEWTKFAPTVAQALGKGKLGDKDALAFVAKTLNASIAPSIESLFDKEEIHNKTLAPSQISGDILDWITTL